MSKGVAINDRFFFKIGSGMWSGLTEKKVNNLTDEEVKAVVLEANDVQRQANLTPMDDSSPYIGIAALESFIGVLRKRFLPNKTIILKNLSIVENYTVKGVHKRSFRPELVFELLDVEINSDFVNLTKTIFESLFNLDASNYDYDTRLEEAQDIEKSLVASMGSSYPIVEYPSLEIFNRDIEKNNIELYYSLGVHGDSIDDEEYNRNDYSADVTDSTVTNSNPLADNDTESDLNARSDSNSSSHDDSDDEDNIFDLVPETPSVSAEKISVVLDDKEAGSTKVGKSLSLPVKDIKLIDPLVHNVTLNFKKFEIDDSDLSKYSPGADGAMDALLNERKKQLNVVISQAEEIATVEIIKNLAAQRKTFEDNLSNKITDMLAKNEFYDVLQKQISEESKDEIARRSNAANQAFMNELAEQTAIEDDRHKQAIAKLKQVADSSIQISNDKIIADVNHSMADEFKKREAQKLKENADLEADLTQESRKYADQAIIKNRTALVSSFEASSSDLYKKLNNDLQDFSSQVHENEAGAISNRRFELDARQRIEEFQKYVADVRQKSDDLVSKNQKQADRIAELEAEKADWLRTKMSLDKSNSGEGVLKDSIGLLTATTLANLQKDETSNISQDTNSVQTRAKQFHVKNWQKVSMGAVLLLLIGGGIGVKSAIDTSNKQHQVALTKNKKQLNLLQKAQSDMSKQASSTKAELDDTKANYDKAQSKVSDLTDELKKSKEKPPVVTSDENKFTALDQSLEAGSTVIYERKFAGKDLVTESRTLAVGKLFLDTGATTSAKMVAYTNEGHNTQLLNLIDSKK
ncbi:phage tail tape measure protein [Periweissella cryptocerci]|uniref:Phage tail tape measure protein n=1 Tax=Periweissella cryptocerci TaxID=2506420 RepID=A0A4P6YWY6_9LACO|nr:phage tail tape measure protein [Periweissella cryptocerci]QBO37392.1 phage tail tape measure protein [Periweissella cryptocerci]